MIGGESAIYYPELSRYHSYICALVMNNNGMNRYKALFFDLDDTLLCYDRCCRYALKIGLEALDIGYSEEVYAIFDDIAQRLFREQKEGKYTVAEVMDLYPVVFVRQMGFGPEKVGPFKHAFRSGWAVSHDLMPDVMETLEWCRGKFDMYIISNSFLWSQLSRLREAGIRDYFRDVYASDMIGYDKPDVRFFEEALRRSSLSASEVLVIGDSLTADIAGAGKAGLDTCWYDFRHRGPSSAVSPVYTVTDLLQIREIPGCQDE